MLTRRELISSAATAAASGLVPSLLAVDASAPPATTGSDACSVPGIAPNREWPVLKAYDQEHLSQIALPIGGIGTGTISLGGRGDLRDVELANRPRKGFVPRHTMFLLRCQKGSDAPVVRVLESELQPPFEHPRGFDQDGYGHYGFPRFRHGAFHAAYPLGQVLLSSPEVPLHVRIEAFNPMIPGDAAASGIPIAVLRFVLRNPTNELVRASVLGCLPNFIGDEYWKSAPPQPRKGNINHHRKSRGDDGPELEGLFMEAPGVPQDHWSFGTLAMAAIGGAGKIATHPGWDPGWSVPKRTVVLERLWRRFEQFGDVDVPQEKNREPAGLLNAGIDVPAESERSLTILIAWHFPNRSGWYPEQADKQADKPRGRNWYATQYSNAWDVLEKVAGQLPKLEATTVEFVRAFALSDVPAVIKEAALFNTSTLRTTTCFRMDDGNFFGFEGSTPNAGCCPGSCNHVWAYESATSYLFGQLARSMRDVGFRHATDDTGRQSYRVALPLLKESPTKKVAADGQMGSLIRFYRDWKLSGDLEWLRALWPKLRAAMAFAWADHGWDGNQDGVMEGVQHNTTDLPLFGPNPVLAGWYLAALRAIEEMAKAVGDEDFARKCRSLFERGSEWVDANLYNGEYYIQIPRRPPPLEQVPEGSWMTLQDLPKDQPLPQQIDNGCQTDQLIGQLWAHVCGLGHVLKPKHVRQTLKTVFRRNFKEMRAHPSFFRAYAMNDEHALVFGTYPKGNVPEVPLFRFSEVWNGCEYAAAAHMIYEGQTESALTVIGAIRKRFDGRKRNPFNEPECGNHYVRSMASWTCYLAWTGFDYDATAAAMQFAAVKKPTQFFWSNGSAWGVARLQPEARDIKVALNVLHGQVRVRSISLSGIGVWQAEEEKILKQGEILVAYVKSPPAINLRRLPIQKRRDGGLFGEWRKRNMDR